MAALVWTYSGWREPDDSSHWPAVILLALVVEVAMLAGAIWLTTHHPSAPPQTQQPVQIVLEASQPPKKSPAPTPPHQVTPPSPKPIENPRPVVHHFPRPPAPHRKAPPPLPVPVPQVKPPPAPVADAKPAMPVAPPAPLVPPPAAPLEPPRPPADVASIKASYEAALRTAIQAAVHYPESARLMQLTGKTLVAFGLRDGTVSNVRIVTSSGIPPLDRAALDAVRGASLPTVPRALYGKSMSFEIWVRFFL